MSWPAYGDYRETDVDWLGSTPSSWSVERMSWLFNDISSGTTPESGNLDFYDGEINWVTTGELREKGISLTEKRVTPTALATYSALRVYPAGTLLIAMYGATIGRLGWLDAPACTNQACCAFANPKRVSTRFAYYALSAARNHLILLASGGGQPNINQDKLRSLRIAVPSRPEQAAIVRFLDAETAKIDTLIAKQEQLIATLREDRTATITHAVTKGLDPAAKMKHSGIEWAGQIPASWPETSIKHLFSVTLGKMLQSEPRSVADRLQPYLRAAHLPPTGFTTDGATEMWFSPNETQQLDLRKGDVVVVEGGMGGYGRCDLVPHDLDGWGFQNSINRLRPLNNNLGAYAMYALQMAREHGFIEALCSVSTMPHLTAEKLGDMRIPFPPRAEQEEIVAFLEDRCARIDSLISKAAEVTQTLGEYRSALITGAVTGKIDVRGAA